MPYAGTGPAVGLAVSVAVHALLLALAGGHLSARKADPAADEPLVVQPRLLPPPREAVRPEPPVRTTLPVPPALPVPTIAAPDMVVAAAPDAPREPASMAAPPAPTTEEWAFAGRYTLKNRKAYGHTWGQQVRSMMGTALNSAGPGHGAPADGDSARRLAGQPPNLVVHVACRRAAGQPRRQVGRWSSRRPSRSRRSQSTALRCTGTIACPTRRPSPTRSHGMASQHERAHMTSV